MKSIIFSLIITTMTPIIAMANSIELLMFESEGCYWCEAWDSEISHIYPKTHAGRIAPLHRIDIDNKEIKSFQLDTIPYFTPTFVVIRNNKEIGRIEGYPGEIFFWGLLENILNTIPEYKTAKDTL